MKIYHRHLFVLVSALYLVASPILYAAPNAEPAVLERGAHHKVIQSESGATYTAMADGMHYQSDGQWAESREEIELFQDGAIARQGPHKTVFAPNLKTAGAIELLTPDGKRFRSHILGLVYFDSASGNSTLIAEIKDSIGQLVAPNRVVYADAFTDIQADVQFTYRRGSFEQDVVLLRKPPSPVEFGLNPDTTRLQVWTEFIEAPVPQQQQIVLRREENPALRQAMAEPDLTDARLDFGAMYMGAGRAFAFEDQQGEAVDTSIHVGKEWATVEQRQFLIESVELPILNALLNALPPAAAAVANPANANLAVRKQPARSKRDLLAQLPRLSLPKLPGGKERIEVAQSAYRPKRAVVLDYVTLSSGQTNYIFKSDVTYFIDGQVTLSGTTTLEGTVIKFNNANSAQLKITGSGAKINCLTSPYRPAILAAKDDNSVGETIYGSSGTPSGYYATYGLYFDYSSSGVLSTNHDIRIRHANTGIYYTSGSSHVVRHSQIVGCNKAVEGGMGAMVRLQNCLLGGYTSINGYLDVRGENLTVSGYSLGSPMPSLTNCLLSLGTAGSYYGVNNYAVSASAFSTIGVGGYYLADSTYRNAGTTAIDPDLATDIKSRTTYGPMLLGGDLTLPTTLGPQAQRDVDLPDCGYHFDPLDYAWTALVLSTNLVLTNGVAVAIYGTNGTILLPGAKFISEGHPQRMNRIVRYGAVQDGSTVWGTSGSYMSLFNLTNTGATLPEIRMRFTDVSLLADTSTEQYVIDTANVYALGVFAFTDCHLRGGYINLANHGTNAQTVTMAFTNNFFQRVNFTFRQGYSSDTTPAPLYFWNNLVIGSTLTVQGGSQSSPYVAWEARDNFFDAVTLSASTFANSRNAYTSATTLPGTGGNDHTNIVPNYATSTLGTNYYGTSTPLSNLINAGSRNRDAATLFHHTVLVAQTTEGEDAGSAVVDIGFHFIALSSGLPKDSDGDGIPDFVENRNGTGTYNSGTDPSDWNSYTSPNGLTGAPGLQVFTPLK